MQSSKAHSLKLVRNLSRQRQKSVTTSVWSIEEIFKYRCGRPSQPFLITPVVQNHDRTVIIEIISLKDG